MYNKSDINKTITILGTLSFFLTFITIYWYWLDPNNFFENKLGLNHSILNPVAWILTILIVLFYVSITINNVPFIKNNLKKLSILKIIGIWSAIFTGFTEEVIFRKLIMDYLHTFNYSIITQVAIASFTFGISHSFWGILSRDLKIILLIVLSTTILGSLLSSLYIITNRSIFFPILAHILINLIIEPWLMLAVISNNVNKK